MTEQVAASAKAYDLDECKNHTTDKDCWLVINSKVYDVTEFLDEHPGGYDIIVTNSGKDATEDYEEIGHSKAANEMLEKYLIGTYKGGDSSSRARKQANTSTSTEKSSAFSALLKALLPLLVLVAAVLYALNMQKSVLA